MTASLTDRDRAALDLAGAYYRHESARLDVARRDLGLSAVRFRQVVNALIDGEAANVERPDVCARLRRVRDRNLHHRGGRRLAA